MTFVAYNMIRFFSERLGLPVLAAKMLAEGLLFFVNFTVQREIVFVRAAPRDERS
jgi:putative flippase GtrA